MKTTSALILFCFILQACDIAAVNYAVNEVQLLEKSPVLIAERPGIKLTISNQSEATVYDVKVTVKAKKNQDDISVILVKLPELKAAESIEKTALFGNLRSHEEYDFLTYAVSFSSNQP